MRVRTAGWLAMVVLVRTAAWLAMVVLVLAAVPAAAWGPGAHVVVALGVAQQNGASVGSDYLALQAAYGATAPDIAWRAEEPLQSALGAAMHDDPGYREPWDLASPWSPVQRAFAWGWLTHNQEWGADHYAHIVSPTDGAGPGYIVAQAAVLAEAQGIPEEVAHDYVEVAVDLLLDQQYPGLRLGGVLKSSAASRDSQVRSLVVKSYADVPGANWWTIRALEATYRAGLGAYGEGLSWPTGADDGAFATAMALMYGLDVGKSVECLAGAKALCQDPEAHYVDALQATVGLVAGGPWP
jgi:hypothetical protein